MIDSTSVLYDAKIAEWEKADDIIKSKNLDNYLVTLNPNDKSAENKARNEQYKERSILCDSWANLAWHGWFNFPEMATN